MFEINPSVKIYARLLLINFFAAAVFVDGSINCYSKVKKKLITKSYRSQINSVIDFGKYIQELNKFDLPANKSDEDDIPDNIKEEFEKLVNELTEGWTEEEIQFCIIDENKRELIEINNPQNSSNTRKQLSKNIGKIVHQNRNRNNNNKLATPYNTGRTKKPLWQLKKIEKLNNKGHKKLILKLNYLAKLRKSEFNRMIAFSRIFNQRSNRSTETSSIKNDFYLAGDSFLKAEDNDNLSSLMYEIKNTYWYNWIKFITSFGFLIYISFFKDIGFSTIQSISFAIVSGFTSFDALLYIFAQKSFSDLIMYDSDDAEEDLDKDLTFIDYFTDKEEPLYYLFKAMSAFIYILIMNNILKF